MTQPPFFFTSYAGRDADSELVGQFHARLQQEVAIKRGVSAAHEGFSTRTRWNTGPVGGAISPRRWGPPAS
ncbi:hypothetical protein FHS35_004079 [Streptomyces umbrinus]|nr:hypothetical protein [Streptomyces umbrinus]